MLRRSFVAIAALVATSGTAAAQTTTDPPAAPAGPPAGTPAPSSPSGGTSNNTTQDIPTLDTTVPDAPAFTILGITPTQITRPKTPSEVAAAIGTAIGTDGRLHAGTAIEIAPGQLFQTIDVNQYNDHLYYQYLHNLQISLATSSSSSTPSVTGMPVSATDLAVGGRLTLYDSSDPLRRDSAIMKAYQEIFSGRKTAPPYPTGSGAATDLPPDVQSKVADALAASKATNWNATAVQLAGAYAWTSPDSSLRNLTHEGWGAWVTGAEGIGAWGQVIGVLRALNGSANSTDPGTTFVAGGRFVVGGPKWGVSAEGAYNHLWANSPAVNDGWGQATAAFEVNLASGSWLELSFGDTFDKLGQNDRFFSLANFKWSVDSQRVILSSAGQ
jgi:hypothetical protein